MRHVRASSGGLRGVKMELLRLRVHCCLLSRSCWSEWWEFGAPMRLHWGQDRMLTFPGFGWRHRRIWASAEPAEVHVAEHLWSVISSETEPEMSWRCADRVRVIRARTAHCARCGDLQPDREVARSEET